MIEYKLLKRRFWEFGGWRLAWEYTKLGLVSVVMKTIFTCFIKRQSLRAVYPVIRSKVCPILADKYKHIIRQSKSRYEAEAKEAIKCEHPNVVWWCWLQGEVNAPAIVKACLDSLRKNLPNDYEIRIIDEINWQEWVTMPKYIVEKRLKGRIPSALYSDLLRLELLIRYGGTWIDSTVLCTGMDAVMDAKKLLEADLFMFQYTTPSSNEFRGISNWFISACSHNKVLMTMRDVLMAYWKDYDCVMDYYIFHFFFEGMKKVYPSEIDEMPYAFSHDALLLMQHWGEVFDLDKWDNLTKRVCFHKLSSRPGKMQNIDNYYNKILCDFAH